MATAVPPRSSGVSPAVGVNDYGYVPRHKLKVPEDVTSKLAVIFFNGTFNPPHPGHLDTLTRAKECLESRGFIVIGGYMSPASTHYAIQKLGAKRIETQHRLNLCQLLVQNTDWVMVDTFECFHPTLHCNPLAIYHHLRSRLLEQIGSLASRDVYFFWLAGPDAGGYVTSSEVHEIIVINRTDNAASIQHARNSEAQLHRLVPEKFFFLVEAPPLNMSSTAIRKGGHLDATYSSFPQIIQYMKDYHLFSETTVETSQGHLISPLRNLAIQELVYQIMTLSNVPLLPSPSHELQIKRIGGEKGFRSRVFKVSNLLTHDGATETSSIVVKLSTNSHVSRTHNFIEYNFYQKIAPQLISLRVPKCYFCHYESCGDSALILEDFSHASTFDYEAKTVPLDIVLLFVKSFAEFHAEFWDHPGFGDSNDSRLGWVPPMNCAENIEYMLGNFGYFWEALKSQRSLFSPEFYNFCLEHNKTVPNLLNTLFSTSPHTLVHGDIWINNLCLFKESFDTDLLRHAAGSPLPQPCVFDWQTSFYGCGLTDLAALLDTCVVVGSNVERCLLLYHDTLLRHGVRSTYTLQRCREDFKLARRWSFLYHIPVLGMGALRIQGNLDDNEVAELLRR
ncbi:hypothetical protein Pelo_10954 [Pelomyxa schiedti]|nr:hypothetical protein Pelo_10954 [Pelomyxa schiedti]